MHVVSIPIFSPAKLYLGQAPGNSFLFVNEEAEIEAVRAKGIDVVVVLQTRSELDWSIPDVLDIYQRNNIKVVHYPIPDMQTPRSIPSLDRIVTLILQLLKQGRNVMIHCYGGKGRTGLVAAAVLIKHTNFTTQQAVSYIRRYRPGAVETPQQMRFLVNYERVVRADE